MIEKREHTVHSAPAAATEHVEAVVSDPYAARRRTAQKARQAIYLVFGVIEGLIAIRFLLALLGANPQAGFAAFIYGVTAPFLAPFVGLFSTPQFANSVLEWHALIAILVYALLSWLLGKLVSLVWGETRSGVVTHASRVDTVEPAIHREGVHEHR